MSRAQEFSPQGMLWDRIVQEKFLEQKASALVWRERHNFHLRGESGLRAWPR